jgi:hypothetical protein
MYLSDLAGYIFSGERIITLVHDFKTFLFIYVTLAWYSVFPVSQTLSRNSWPTVSQSLSRNPWPTVSQSLSRNL